MGRAERQVVRLTDFEGKWHIARAIRDRLTDSDGRFEGDAVFAPVPAGMLYREEGLLTLGSGPALTAVRSYLWREAGGRIYVNYPDGRPFHDFDEADPVARHVCDPDDYRVRYDFGSWPIWRSEWVVKGPRKDYTMLTDYAPGN